MIIFSCIRLVIFVMKLIDDLPKNIIKQDECKIGKKNIVIIRSLFPNNFCEINIDT